MRMNHMRTRFNQQKQHFMLAWMNVWLRGNDSDVISHLRLKAFHSNKMNDLLQRVSDSSLQIITIIQLTNNLQVASNLRLTINWLLLRHFFSLSPSWILFRRADLIAMEPLVDSEASSKRKYQKPKRKRHYYAGKRQSNTKLLCNMIL